MYEKLVQNKKVNWAMKWAFENEEHTEGFMASIKQAIASGYTYEDAMTLVGEFIYHVKNGPDKTGE